MIEGSKFIMEWKILGIIAAICTTSSFIPQVIKGIRTKKLEDVSPAMYAFLIFGFSLWLAYGIHLRDVIIIGANVAAMLSSVLILLLRFKFLRQK